MVTMGLRSRIAGAVIAAVRTSGQREAAEGSAQSGIAASTATRTPSSAGHGTGYDDAIARRITGLEAEAQSIEQAVEAALGAGARTKDLDPKAEKPLSTSAMGARMRPAMRWGFFAKDMGTAVEDSGRRAWAVRDEAG